MIDAYVFGFGAFLLVGIWVAFFSKAQARLTLFTGASFAEVGVTDEASSALVKATSISNVPPSPCSREWILFCPRLPGAVFTGISMCPHEPASSKTSSSSSASSENTSITQIPSVYRGLNVSNSVSVSLSWSPTETLTRGSASSRLARPWAAMTLTNRAPTAPLAFAPNVLLLMNASGAVSRSNPSKSGSSSATLAQLSNSNNNLNTLTTRALILGADSMYDCRNLRTLSFGSAASKDCGLDFTASLTARLKLPNVAPASFSFLEASNSSAFISLITFLSAANSCEFASVAASSPESSEPTSFLSLRL
mmetsp:Transcript_57712/g.153846  ORF Transcript_57712/g.153846 Transcript_57712/m.153846 type:complete len:308 (-) Transcript_57712:574-1497(-)